MTHHPIAGGYGQQLELFRDIAYELTISFGIVPDEDHLQAQIELKACGSGRLVLCESWAHAPVAAVGELADEVAQCALNILEDLAGPF